MNGDIRPTRPRPTELPRSVVDAALPPVATKASRRAAGDRPHGLTDSLRPPRRFRRLGWAAAIIVALIVLVGAGAYGWYQFMLSPIDTDDSTKVTVTIESGMTPDIIAGELTEGGLIRSKAAFLLYTRVTEVQDKLQVGSYQLTKAMALPAIVDILAGGKSDQLTLTFYPGATLHDPTSTPDDKRTDVYTMLQRAGFSDSEVTAALAKAYEHPLFVDKPTGTSLEGYVYGETYQFAPGVSAEAILEHTFDVYYRQLEEHSIAAGAKRQGLTLYQAITLASIIEREVHSAEDQRQVAGVFYNRLKRNMPLGSDVTFIYAAEQQNKTPTVDFDSPYNTRIHKGLPPGPIATPGLTALQAVANPAANDYLYFIAGDDGKTYFAHTEEEHQENIEKHCQKLCYE